MESMDAPWLTIIISRSKCSKGKLDDNIHWGPSFQILVALRVLRLGRFLGSFVVQKKYEVYTYKTYMSFASLNTPYFPLTPHP